MKVDELGCECYPNDFKNQIKLLDKTLEVAQRYGFSNQSYLEMVLCS